MVEGLAENFSVDSYVDLELREHLLRSCKDMGVNLQEITPIRNAGKPICFSVVAHSCVDGDGCELSIAPAISSILGEKVEVCNKECPRRRGVGACQFNLMKAFNYKINSAVVQVARKDVCGDSLSITTLKDGKELVVLSDGMGVGEEAAAESRTAVNLLEDLLNGGFEKEMALQTINSVLLLRSTQETYTTLDMVLADLYTAEVDFIKTAAAPSFIKRGKQVAIIRSSSLPIGILNNIEVVSDRRVLQARDMLLMVSDGVLEASREVNGEEWIAKLLTDIGETDPKIVAELIINQALAICQGKPKDDMTVICLTINLN
jgi:stage II sporulation protein E